MCVLPRGLSIGVGDSMEKERQLSSEKRSFAINNGCTWSNVWLAVLILSPYLCQYKSKTTNCLESPPYVSGHGRRMRKRNCVE